MRRILKYPLELKDKQMIQASEGCISFLDAQVQNGAISLWAEEDVDSPKCDYLVRIYGTGYEIPEEFFGIPHFRTVQLDGCVWHIYISKVYV